jgi:hypothetical protein
VPVSESAICDFRWTKVALTHSLSISKIRLKPTKASASSAVITPDGLPTNTKTVEAEKKSSQMKYETTTNNSKLFQVVFVWEIY